MKIGLRLLILRNNHDLTLTELSKMSRVSPSYLCKIETYRTNPSLSTCEKLAKIYNMTLSELFDGVGG